MEGYWHGTHDTYLSLVCLEITEGRRIPFWLCLRRLNIVSSLAVYLYPVYEARRKPRAKAIIDIDHCDPCRAGVKHSE